MHALARNASGLLFSKQVPHIPSCTGPEEACAALVEASPDTLLTSP